MSQWPGRCNYSARMLWNQSSRWRHSWDPCPHRWPSVWGWWALCTACRHVLAIRLLGVTRTRFLTCALRRNIPHRCLNVKQTNQKKQPQRWAGHLTQTEEGQCTDAIREGEGWLSPRALWEALGMRQQQSNVPLGMRASVFDLLPVDHHDQQHDEAEKSESWHHHQGDNPHHPAHSWMRSSRYIGQDGPVWNSTMFGVVYLSLSLGEVYLLQQCQRVFFNATNGGRHVGNIPPPPKILKLNQWQINNQYVPKSMCC